jgi:putative Mn2+ efflux pump MntP
MRIFEVTVLTLGLTMDVFGVSIAVGLALPHSTFRQRTRLSWHFAVFHFLMPILGWVVGIGVARLIARFDHCAAFVLLSFVGGRMIWEAREQRERLFTKDPTRGLTLVFLCVATSIDALVLGFSLALLEVQIWHVAILLGLVAALMTFIGLNTGSTLGQRFRGWAHLIGGTAIIAVGVKIMLEHTVG